MSKPLSVPTAPAGMSDIQQALVVNEVLRDYRTERNDFVKRMAGGGKRDYYAEAGWRSNPGFKDYQSQYRRNPVARRALKAFPSATWSTFPDVYESTDSRETAFEDGIKTLINNPKLRLKKRLQQLDRAASLGQFAIMLLGLPGEVNTPAVGGPLVFLRVYQEDCVVVKETETDGTNERFGLPTMYTLTTKTGNQTSTKDVHYTRVLHVAYECEEGDTNGTPFLQPVLNYLQTLDMAIAASGEGYWKSCVGGLAIKTLPGAEITEANENALRRDISDYMNELRRYLVIQGGEPVPITLDFKDPTALVKTIISLVAAGINIPQRKLIGSEEAKLASSQDEDSWRNVVNDRNKNVVEPEMLRPFIYRLIELKVVPAPSDINSFIIDWPDPNSLTPTEKADYGMKFVNTLVAYCNSPAPSIITPFALLTKVFGFSDEDATQFLEDAQKEMKGVDGVGIDAGEGKETTMPAEDEDEETPPAPPEE
jgi:hypothetical protein